MSVSFSEHGSFRSSAIFSTLSPSQRPRGGLTTDPDGASLLSSQQDKRARVMNFLFQSDAVPIETGPRMTRTLRFVDGEIENEFIESRGAVVIPRFRVLFGVVVFGNTLFTVFMVLIGAYIGALIGFLPVPASLIGHLAFKKYGWRALRTVYVTFSIFGCLTLTVIRAANDVRSPSWAYLVFVPAFALLFRPSFREILIVLAGSSVLTILGTLLHVGDPALFMTLVLPPVYLSVALVHAAFLSEKEERKLFSLQLDLKLQQRSLASENKKMERLLYNVFPTDIARAISFENRNDTFSDTFDGASVLLLDIVGFTKMSAAMESADLVHILNTFFLEFDRVAERYSVVKIKTIGDAYLAVSGCPIPSRYSARNMSFFALDLIEVAEKVSAKIERDIQVRIGLATGEVSAGIVGNTKRLYDIFGPAVDRAFRLEANSKPMQIHCNRRHRELVGDEFRFVDAELAAEGADAAIPEEDRTSFLMGVDAAAGGSPPKFQSQTDQQIMASWDAGDVKASGTARVLMQKRLDAAKQDQQSVFDIYSSAYSSGRGGGGGNGAGGNSNDNCIDNSGGGEKAISEALLERWTQRFKDPALENEFVHARRTHNSFHTVSWIGYLLIFEAIYIEADLHLGLDELSYSVPIRAFVAIPAIAISLALSFPVVIEAIGTTVAIRTANLLVFVAGIATSLKVLLLSQESTRIVSPEAMDTIGAEYFVFVCAAMFLPKSTLFGSTAAILIQSVIMAMAYLLAARSVLEIVWILLSYLVVYVILSLYTRVQTERIDRLRFAQQKVLVSNNDLLQDRIALSQQLVLTVLPPSVYERLVETSAAFAESYTDVTVMFVTVHRFSALSRKLTVAKLLEALSEIFESFESMCESYQVEKLKAFDGTFMCVAGITDGGQRGGGRQDDHLRRSIELGLAMLHHVKNVKVRALDGVSGVKAKIQLRIGVQAGPVVAGVIGTTRLTFDCYGDVVNTASRMATKGVAGKVQIPAETYERVEDVYDAEHRSVNIKGKGKMATALVESRRQAFVPGALAPIKGGGAALEPPLVEEEATLEDMPTEV